MKFARIIDGAVHSLVEISSDVLGLPPLRGPSKPTRSIGPTELADLEHRVATSLPWDIQTGELIPVVEPVKPTPTPTQLIEQIGSKIGVDKVEPIYEARTKPVPTAPSVKELLDRIETVERDLSDAKGVPIKGA